MTNQIVSLSGGKDSTAMLLMMLERGERIHSAVFFDTGWEFPAMHDHLDQLEATVDVPVVRLVPERSFDYWMFEHPAIARKGPNKGQVHRIGSGWPSPVRRWCTRQKVDEINKYARKIPNAVQCIGYAADETKRHENPSKELQEKKHRFPLVEWGITEAQALAYCKGKGFEWGGLYDLFDRVSCFCCPLQRLSELRNLRAHFPGLWERMLKMDGNVSERNRGFKNRTTVHDLERRFAGEDSRDERQLKLF